MNIEMLKFLVRNSSPDQRAVDVGAFSEAFPDSDDVREDLKTLKTMGFVDALYFDDQLYHIETRAKAHDYFAK